MKELSDSGIHISNLIIDDNWQSIERNGADQFHSGWLDFEANPDGFPNGLRGVVSKLRQTNPELQNIAVWHAILGYWGGISAHGKLAQTYKTVELDRNDYGNGSSSSSRMVVIAKDDVENFFRDFYAFLIRSGVNTVKTDAQFMMDTWQSASARRSLIPSYLDAWSMAALRNFGSQAISCMSQFPQAMFYSQLPQTRPSILLRNSDDFFPDEPASHAWHIWANAHNSILSQHLNVVPDWDMFQTDHEYAAFHAAARCVSGGPICITDVPGRHDIALISQISGQNPRGKTVIFRPSVIGKATHAFVSYDDNILLKIGSYHGELHCKLSRCNR
jgi:hypothetical protein